MEFVELLMLTIAVLFIIFKPEKEKWAWWLTVGRLGGRRFHVRRSCFDRHSWRT